MEATFKFDQTLKELSLMDKTLITRFKSSYQLLTGRNKVYLYKVIDESEGSFNINIVCGFMILSNLAYINTIVHGLNFQKNIEFVDYIFYINSNFDISVKPVYIEQLGSKKLASLLVQLYSITTKIKSFKLHDVNWAFEAIVYNQYILKSMDLYEDIAKEKLYISGF